MGFFGLPVINGDFGGETSTPSFSSGDISAIGTGVGSASPFSSDNGTAPTPSNPGSGGSFLNELGAFSGILTSGVSNIIKAENTPRGIVIPRTTNLPSSSLQRLTGNSNSSILMWVLVALAVVIGLKFLRK